MVNIPNHPSGFLYATVAVTVTVTSGVSLSLLSPLIRRR
jgi:hypothetical protein